MMKQVPTWVADLLQKLSLVLPRLAQDTQSAIIQLHATHMYKHLNLCFASLLKELPSVSSARGRDETIVTWQKGIILYW